jgi:hypothetical protein
MTRRKKFGKAVSDLRTNVPSLEVVDSLLEIYVIEMQQRTPFHDEAFATPCVPDHLRKPF